MDGVTLTEFLIEFGEFIVFMLFALLIAAFITFALISVDSGGEF